MSDKEAKIETKAVKESKVKTKNAKNAENATIPNYKKFIEIAQKNTVEEMLKLEEKTLGNLSKEQLKGLKIYTGSAYEQMNGYLRYIAAGKTHEDAMWRSGLSEAGLEHLRNAIAGLNSTFLGKDLVLRRGTDLGDLAGFMQGNFGENISKLAKMSAEELNNMFAGSIGTYAGFTSTSSIWNSGFDGDVEMVFYAPKETRASSLMSISRYGTDEGETLLNAGTRVKILKVEESNGHMGSRFCVFAEILAK